ncbi:LPXTG cell wall anchor domain-containing protein [Enterococcus gilvus]|jgi:LPXTG-motif cell wall-anchored protein|uniref:LPXTG-domain-containing protein cell wall anchor domain n=1 Tax=Enterococcus gilvus ATCC BAA-350 TaxID=1158614 RepID=R2XVE7_9ENTE|nr:LPXTG cell wall anchor domain-containing protein [Enterococcus gilvus]EOI53937.1 LPXTG-domain-containing protein cell wall anchor domain [Enterococcus gilvus ATCC BAA-350]EOW80788.1 hypothetical protein I592_00072 [Enterococcus gilvus ATCC BAA-350]MBS5821206.1 LPXTG cell wall anchor domain-containing protein [Enterococcus gilvus]
MKKKLLIAFIGLVFSSTAFGLTARADSYLGGSKTNVSFVDKRKAPEEPKEETKITKTKNQTFHEEETHSSKKAYPQTGSIVQQGISILGIIVVFSALILYFVKNRREKT